MFHSVLLVLYLSAPYCLSRFELGFGSASVVSLLAAEGLVLIVVSDRGVKRIFPWMDSRVVRGGLEAVAVVGFLVFVVPEWISLLTLSLGGTEWMLRFCFDGFFAVFEHDYQLMGITPFYLATVLLVFRDVEQQKEERYEKGIGRNRKVVDICALPLGLCLRCYWFWLYRLTVPSMVSFFFNVGLSLLVIIGLTVVLRLSIGSGSFEEFYSLFCVGLFAWHAGLRIISIDCAALLFPLLALTCFGITIVLSMGSTARNRDGANRSVLLNPAGVHEEAAQVNEPYGPLLATYGLTKREIQISELSLEGLSSSQCAKRLDISPSTVRNTLNRVYRKIGVSGLDAFRARMNTALAEKNETPIKRNETTANGKRGLFVLVFQVLVFAFSVLPNTMLGTQFGWNTGNETVLAVGFATLLTAVLQDKIFGNRWISLIFSVQHGLLPFLMSMALSATCLYLRFDNVAAPLGRSASLFLMVLAYTIIFSICAAEKNDAVRSLVNSVGKCLSEATGSTKACCCICLLFLGFAYEESWRAYSALSLFDSIILFLSAWCSFSISAFEPKVRSSHFVACFLVMSALLFLFPFLGLICVFCLTVFALLSCDATTSKCLLICFALGVLGGDYAIDAVVDALFAFNPAVLSLFSSSVSLWTVAAYTSVLFNLAGVLACIAMAYELAWSHKVADISISESDYWERFSHYLRAKGLSSGDVSLLLLVVKGRSIKEIGKELSYSASAVHAAKARAFRKLGISSRIELLKLFSELDGV